MRVPLPPSSPALHTSTAFNSWPEQNDPSRGLGRNGEQGMVGAGLPGPTGAAGVTGDGPRTTLGAVYRAGAAGEHAVASSAGPLSPLLSLRPCLAARPLPTFHFGTARHPRPGRGTAVGCRYHLAGGSAPSHLGQTGDLYGMLKVDESRQC